MHIPPDLDIRLIAAVGKRGQLGLNGKLPWHDAQDLIWFRDCTKEGIVIVGHRTYEELRSILPVKTEQPGIGFTTSASRAIIRDESHLNIAQFVAEGDFYGRPIWIAGGAKTYRRWMPLVRRFYIGKAIVDGQWYDGPADAFLPPLVHRTYPHPVPTPA